MGWTPFWLAVMCSQEGLVVSGLTLLVGVFGTLLRIHSGDTWSDEGGGGLTEWHLDNKMDKLQDKLPHCQPMCWRRKTSIVWTLTIFFPFGEEKKSHFCFNGAEGCTTGFTQLLTGFQKSWAAHCSCWRHTPSAFSRTERKPWFYRPLCTWDGD